MGCLFRGNGLTVLCGHSPIVCCPGGTRKATTSLHRAPRPHRLFSRRWSRAFCWRQTLSGITAGYAFDETSGTTAADASGHGITGTLTNGPTFTPGKNGNAVTLDGVNDYVNLGNPTALQFTGSMTVSAWVYASAFPVDDAAVVSKRTAGEVGFQLDITKDTGPRTIGFKLTNSSGGQMFRYGATTLQLNTWYYITGVYNAANQSLDVYLNGALDNGHTAGDGYLVATELDGQCDHRPARGRDRF